MGEIHSDQRSRSFQCFPVLCIAHIKHIRFWDDFSFLSCCRLFRWVWQPCRLSMSKKILRSSRFQTFHRIGVFKNLAKACSFIKRRFQHRCSPVNFTKFLRTTFLQNTSERLLLNPRKMRPKPYSKIFCHNRISDDCIACIVLLYNLWRENLLMGRMGASVLTFHHMKMIFMVLLLISQATPLHLVL